MDQRLTTKYQEIISKAESFGVKNSYFEPPANIKMTYPCMVLKRGVMSSRHAGNRTYKVDDAWDITWIRLDPDDGMVHKFLDAYQMIRHARTYVADGLHHDQFKLYY